MTEQTSFKRINVLQPREMGKKLIQWTLEPESPGNLKTMRSTGSSRSTTMVCSSSRAIGTCC
jgi:hypothetical protein